MRAVVTDSARGQSLKDKGAEVVVADVEDRNALERVFSGAEGVYVLLPPNHSSKQIRADNGRRAKNIAAAIAAAGVGHTVLLSSIGAQHTLTEQGRRVVFRRDAPPAGRAFILQLEQ